MKIQDALMNLLLKQPYYGFMAASLNPAESDRVPRMGISLLPVPRLVYNREWYEGLEDGAAIGVLIHEMLHLVLQHPFRKGNREHLLWTAACDMAVNEHIDPALLPEGSITVDEISKEIGSQLPRMKTAEAYYELIDKAENSVSFLETNSWIKVMLGDGRELKADNYTEDNSSELDMKAVTSMVSDLLQQAGEEGDVPGGLNALIGELYKAGEVNWRNVLKRFLTGKGRVQVRKSCKKESKRYEGLPGNKRTNGVTALLALDESGSVSEGQLSSFYNEVLAVKRITGADILVTQFDSACTEPVTIQRYVRSRERSKGGGTDFRPVFELAGRMRIPLLMILTDGEGPAPVNSDQNVLWVLTVNGKKPAGYGHCITIPG